MKILYVHGLDSSAQSVKGQLLEQYCQTHYPNIDVYRPDLNVAPVQVFRQLYQSIEQNRPENSIVMGSSLGGYFASLISNMTGCAAVLLNPSTQPHLSLQRFVKPQHLGLVSDVAARVMDDKTILYQTSGGWKITYPDLQWFDEHKLNSLKYPKKVMVIIKEGDALLNPKIAIKFYQQQGAKVIVQSGGDHRMTDFDWQLPLIFEHLQPLLQD